MAQVNREFTRAQLADLVLPTQTPDGLPAPALKFGQPRAMALLGALCRFACVPEGVTNGRLRPVVAQLLAVPADAYTTRQMGYDLRRLARKGLLSRVPGRLCYTLTPLGGGALRCSSRKCTRGCSARGFKPWTLASSPTRRHGCGRSLPRWTRPPIPSSRRPDLHPKISDMFVQTVVLQDC